MATNRLAPQPILPGEPAHNVFETFNCTTFFDRPLTRFDVVLRTHDIIRPAHIVAVGVYAVNYWHALEIARTILPWRGPMVLVRDHAANVTHWLGDAPPTEVPALAIPYVTP